ncbi:MAG: adenylate/guanylate cyclase domain-containing protein [Planctomycetota bacterium]
MGDRTVEETVLFADIAGSTRIYEELGDEAGRTAVMNCLDVVARVIREHGGTVIERIGDERLATFPEADSAAETAADLHTKVTFASFRGDLGYRMRIRVGFEHGSVVETDQGLFGNTVHAAARLAALAKAGQTLTSKQTLQLLADDFQLQSRHYDSVVLKGRTGECEVYEMIWSLQATRIPVRKKVRPAKRAARGVELEYDGRILRVDAERPRVELGRDPACDICVEGDSVSQLHARVTWNRGEVRLEDVSTNGTVMERPDRPPLRLHHLGAALLGSGALRLGVPEDAQDSALVRYRCDLEEEPLPPGESAST